ncbi:MAG: MarR family transcriptional regulator [Anaerolineae bacterium]|nr:MarR family transcriptional regulator [Anaerolineae bacterium]
MTAQTLGNVAVQLLAVLPLVYRAIVHDLQQESGQDISLSQFRVLFYLTEQPLTLSALARKRQVSLQAASELVQVMVERGWIIRLPDPANRRQAFLRLTHEGQRCYERIHNKMVEHLVLMLQKFSQPEVQALQVVLPALQRVMGINEHADAAYDN